VVWEDRVGLDELLWKVVTEPLEDIGAKARTGAICDGVHEQETLKVVIKLLLAYMRSSFTSKESLPSVLWLRMSIMSS